MAHMADYGWVVEPICLVDSEIVMCTVSTCKIFRIDDACFTIEGGGILHITEMRTACAGENKEQTVTGRIFSFSNCASRDL